MSITDNPSDRHTQWQQYITAWQQSGLSQAAFCQSHQLSYHQFVYWRQKLVPQSDQAQPATSRQLLPVHCRSEMNAPLSVILPNGLRIQGIDSHNLALVPQLWALLS